MMASWLVFASWTPEDTALWNSYWMAQKTIRLAPFEPALIERERAIRAELDTALKDETIEGLALFGHGREDSVRGTDGRSALDIGNIASVGRRWVHALACLTGCELVPASASFVDFFVGYHVSLIVEWTIEELPLELQDRLAHLVTATTFALLDGVREKPELQRRVAEAADAVSVWLLDNTEDGYLGIHVLAQQLVDRMVVSR